MQNRETSQKTSASAENHSGRIFTWFNHLQMQNPEIFLSICLTYTDPSQSSWIKLKKKKNVKQNKVLGYCHGSCGSRWKNEKLNSCYVVLKSILHFQNKLIMIISKIQGSRLITGGSWFRDFYKFNPLSTLLCFLPPDGITWKYIFE